MASVPTPPKQWINPFESRRSTNFDLQWLKTLSHNFNGYHVIYLSSALRVIVRLRPSQCFHNNLKCCHSRLAFDSKIFTQIQSDLDITSKTILKPKFYSPSGRCLEIGDYMRPSWMGKHSPNKKSLSETSAVAYMARARRHRVQREVYTHEQFVHVSTQTSIRTHIRFSSMKRARFNTCARASVHTTHLCRDDICFLPKVLETEIKYVHDLGTLVHEYFEPLLQLATVAHAWVNRAAGSMLSALWLDSAPFGALMKLYQS